jgi:hypothetical protein
MLMKQFFMRFLYSHIGKATAGFMVADLILGVPIVLNWLVAAGLIGWSVKELRTSFRLLGNKLAAAKPLVPEVMVVTPAELAPEPGVNVIDILERAAALESSRRRRDVPAIYSEN